MYFKRRTEAEAMVYNAIERIAEFYDFKDREEFEQFELMVYYRLDDVFSRDFIFDQLQEFYRKNPEYKKDEEDEDDEEL